jgi:hypothetical protein
MAARNTCEVHVGRLVEIRIDAGYNSVKEVAAVVDEFVQQCARIPSSERVVIVTDWSKCHVMATDAAEHLVMAMRIVNPRVERSGSLLPVSSSVAMLQFARMLRETHNPDRRGFSDARSLIGWLAEVLTHEEVSRLRSFIGS